MKIHEIRQDIQHESNTSVRECWEWLKERLISPNIGYSEFLDRLKTKGDEYIFDYAFKPIQMKFEGEWEGSPLKIKAGSINFRDSDCRKLEIETLVDGVTSLYLTRCPTGNLDRFVPSINKIDYLSIAGTEDVTHVCDFVGAIVDHGELVLRMEGIEIDARPGQIIVYDKSSTWRDESKFDNVFDLQSWMIEKGFEYLA